MLGSEKTSILENVLPDERTRLVRLCARLTGDVDAAEDLAQETLLEAWRHAHKLHDPRGYTPWLSAIARNVCLRWRWRRGRELPHLAKPHVHQYGDKCDLLDAQADDFDLELELERSELATLLDRALALLPPDTRAALVERYVEGTPLAEAAARLKMSESGLKARVHRGKLTLRRVLLQDFPDDAAAYGLLQRDTAMGEQTRIWCSECGQARLHGIFDRGQGELSLGCPHCDPGQATGSSWVRLPEVFQGVTGYRAAFSRQLAWVHAYAYQALNEQVVACVYCGGPATPHFGPPVENLPRLQGRRGVHVRCATCDRLTWTSLGSLALSLPEGRRFWRRYPRIHALPERQVEVDGVAAIVKSYGEHAGAARFDVVFARSTLDVLHVYGDPASGKADPC